MGDVRRHYQIENERDEATFINNMCIFIYSVPLLYCGKEVIARMHTPLLSTQYLAGVYSAHCSPLNSSSIYIFIQNEE